MNPRALPSDLPSHFADHNPAMYSEHMLADLLILDKKLFLELLLGVDREPAAAAFSRSMAERSP